MIDNYSKFAIAPMMDWTDRHCRFFHRQLSARAVLYTEMLTAQAVIHGDRKRLLDFHPSEHPVVLQLGGSEPGLLAEAAVIGRDWGYDEINLNCGCPSDRVQSGAFGACLMLDPDHVARCVEAMATAVDCPVTVKCRLGVDEQSTDAPLDRFIAGLRDAGCRHVIVHARKAWLEGLSPKENRDVPPLDYDRVYRLKQDFCGLRVTINGGIGSLQEADRHLQRVDAVMLGRAAYQSPRLLMHVDTVLTGENAAVDQAARLKSAIDAMAAYAEGHIASGGRLAHVTRHMVGLCQGLPGARRYRQILSTDATRPGADSRVLFDAVASVDLSALDPPPLTAVA